LQKPKIRKQPVIEKERTTNEPKEKTPATWFGITKKNRKISGPEGYRKGDFISGTERKKIRKRSAKLWVNKTRHAG